MSIFDTIEIDIFYFIASWVLFVFVKIFGYAMIRRASSSFKNQTYFIMRLEMFLILGMIVSAYLVYLLNQYQLNPKIIYYFLSANFLFFTVRSLYFGTEYVVPITKPLLGYKQRINYPILLIVIVMYSVTLLLERSVIDFPELVDFSHINLINKTFGLTFVGIFLGRLFFSSIYRLIGGQFSLLLSFFGIGLLFYSINIRLFDIQNRYYFLAIGFFIGPLFPIFSSIVLWKFNYFKKHYGIATIIIIGALFDFLFNFFQIQTLPKELLSFNFVTLTILVLAVLFVPFEFKKDSRFFQKQV